MDCCKCYVVEDVVRAVGSLIQYIWALAADWLHDEECGWESNHQVTLEIFEKMRKNYKMFITDFEQLDFFSNFTV